MNNVKSTENLEKLDKLLGQFPGERAVFYVGKLGWSRSKTYDYLNSLQIRERAYSKNGLWYPKKAEAEKPSVETFTLPNPNLTEKELKRYSLDVEYLSILKQNHPQTPEWSEAIKQEEAELLRKYGISVTEKKGSLG